MKKLIVIFTVLLCFAPLVRAQDFPRQMESLALDSRILGGEVRFSVVLPADYNTSGERYPVIYMFHGIGGNEGSWIEYADVAAVQDRMVAAGEIGPFIAVMPAGGSEYYSDFADGSYPYMTMLTDELVPHIDTRFRTLPQARYRAATGYSMGGFGALAVVMKNPDLFSVSVPLSASIRTDSQYMSEEADGWDRQWGRIFGGTGQSGQARITDYYRNNSPIHLARTMDAELLSKIDFYIINGDKEGTLCRSNEELHRAMIENGVRHLYRVDGGGHDFAFWNRMLPEVLKFADSAFKGRSYQPEYEVPQTEKAFQPQELSGEGFTLYFPEDTVSNKRRYPVVYTAGIEDEDFDRFYAAYHAGLSKGEYIPLIFCRLADGNGGLETLFANVEGCRFVRPGQRFRAVWLRGRGDGALWDILAGDNFSCAVFSDAYLGRDEAEFISTVADAKAAGRKCWAFIDTASDWPFYDGNSWLHVVMQERGLEHRFRARAADYPVLYIGMDEALKYIAERFRY